MGFSFHDTADELDRLLTAHPDMEFVQLQINYADWENGSIQSRKCYETALKHNKPIVIMEPVKGGALANLPEQVGNIFKEADPSLPQASWAIRFAASLQNVITVLSGMSTLDQMKSNISYMENFKPLSAEEKAVVEGDVGDHEAGQVESLFLHESLQLRLERLAGPLHAVFKQVTDRHQLDVGRCLHALGRRTRTPSPGADHADLNRPLARRMDAAVQRQCAQRGTRGRQYGVAEETASRGASPAVDCALLGHGLTPSRMLDGGCGAGGPRQVRVDRCPDSNCIPAYRWQLNAVNHDSQRPACQRPACSVPHGPLRGRIAAADLDHVSVRRP